MYVGDICEESKASIEDDSANILYDTITHSKFCNICL